MTRISLEMAGATDQGLVRERNEDCIKALPDHGIAVLADGMGGHLAGDTASNMAVEIITEELLSGDIRKVDGSYVHTEEDLIASIRKANRSIRSRAKSDPRCYGMGATVVVLVVSDSVLVCHLGDSRAYSFRRNKLVQITEDHTLAQRYLNEGIMSSREARNWSGRNLLVKGLGIEKNVEPDVSATTIDQETIFLLCSDGLTDVVSEEKISRRLRTAKYDLKHCANELIDLAIAGGGPDNISVILVRVATD